MNPEVLKKLKGKLLASEKFDLGDVPTSSYALNKVISGDYLKGIPIGGITQFKGESSTAKSAFVTDILCQAQKKGYYTILNDAEKAFNPEFAKIFNIDPSQLIYLSEECIEDAFDELEKTINAIREIDKDTPIVAAYDSLAVSPTKKELDAKTYEQSPVDGAYRAKVMGGCLRKMNSKLRKQKIALIVVNQIRSKIGVMYGSPDTNAAGGRSLEYYIHVDLKTISNKTSDVQKDDEENPLGISGKVKNTKNKVSIPFRECDFDLVYNKGFDPLAGLLDWLIKDGIVKQNGAWYDYNSKKFQKKDFASLDPVKWLSNNNVEFSG